MARNKKRAAVSARFEAKFRIVQSETMDLIVKLFEKVFCVVKEIAKKLPEMSIF